MVSNWCSYVEVTCRGLFPPDNVQSSLTATSVLAKEKY